VKLANLSAAYVTVDVVVRDCEETSTSEVTETSLTIKLHEFIFLRVTSQRRTVSDVTVVWRVLTNHLTQPVPRRCSRRDVIVAC